MSNKIINRLKVLSDHNKGVIVLVWLAFIYAIMGIFVRYLNTSFAIFQQIYLRMFAAFLMSLIFFNKSLDLSKLRRITLKEWSLLTLRSISFYILGVNLFTRALLLTKYSNVSFIGSLPLTAFFGFLLFKEKLTIKKVLLIILAFGGVMLISAQDYSNLLSWVKGDFYALISAVFFSFAYVTRKWHSNLLTNKEITSLILLIGSIILFLASILAGESLPSSGWSLGIIIAVLASGFFNVLNNFLSQYGFQKVEAVHASNILTLESAFAVLIGLIVFSETPALKEILGGLLIVASVILMNKVEAKNNT
ncbi:MAG: Membrane protein [Microgenomates group bacterium Gr01-1014_16]|nr:MAG: Membrane protein [Microgenomates group bacterium Gr01-1014_16]